MATVKPLNESYLSSLQPLYESTDGPSLAFLRGMSQESYCRSWYLVGNGKPKAVAWYSRACEEAELIDFRVVCSWRRRGLGRQLLRTTLSALASEGVNKVNLEVKVSNEAAIAFYGMMGFVETARRTDYYFDHSGRKDAILMSIGLRLK